MTKEQKGRIYKDMIDGNIVIPDDENYIPDEPHDEHYWERLEGMRKKKKSKAKLPF